MKKLVLISALISVALLNVSCTNDEIAANEAKAKSILTAVVNGARVAVATVKQGVDAVCANTSGVATGAMVVRAGLGLQNGPITSANLSNLDTALNTLNAVCNRVAANPNDPAMASLLRTAWTAYTVAKTAQSNASRGG